MCGVQGSDVAIRFIWWERCCGQGSAGDVGPLGTVCGAGTAPRLLTRDAGYVGDAQAQHIKTAGREQGSNLLTGGWSEVEIGLFSQGQVTG